MADSGTLSEKIPGMKFFISTNEEGLVVAEADTDTDEDGIVEYVPTVIRAAARALEPIQVTEFWCLLTARDRASSVRGTIVPSIYARGRDPNCPDQDGEQPEKNNHALDMQPRPSSPYWGRHRLASTACRDWWPALRRWLDSFYWRSSWRVR